MDLEIYEQENQFRKNYQTQCTTNTNDTNTINTTIENKTINDEENLVLFSEDHERILLNEDDPSVVAKTRCPNDQSVFISRKDFNKRFHNLSGGVMSYVNWDNVVVAGGCVSNTINPNYDVRNLCDVDLFLYGLNEEEARDKVTEIIESVRSYCDEQFRTRLHILKNDYVVSLIPNRRDKREHKVQIITRLYTSVYEILAGFDIDSGCTAYNGRDVFLTRRSLNAFQTRYNVVDLSRRSPSYESRLYKYYKRGFGIYIPFEYKSQNNKLYFMNSKAQGVDKLMHLLKYSKTRNFNKFLNIITQRINKRPRFGSNSTYEAAEFVFENGDIRNDIIEYNKVVPDEFKLKLYDRHSKVAKKISFLKENPGQQLTGSFNPITDADWINVDYAESETDFIGRNKLLLKIKSGQTPTVSELSVPSYDSSLFNPLHYMIMYSSQDAELIKTWAVRETVCEDKNLYNISYLENAALMNRQQFVKFVLSEETKKVETATGLKRKQIYTKRSSSSRSELKHSLDREVENMIKICFMTDNVEMLLILGEFKRININNYKDYLKRYNAVKIAGHYCVKINHHQKLNTIGRLKKMSSEERMTYLHNLWYNWGYYYTTTDLNNIYEDIDYSDLTMDELGMLNCLEKSNKKLLYKKCKDDLRSENINTTSVEYVDGTFEKVWNNHCHERIFTAEDSKDQSRHEYATKILREMFDLDDEKYEKLLTLDVPNPSQNTNPFVFNIMRCVYAGDFDSLKNHKKLFRDREEYEPLAELLVMMDNVEVLPKVIGESRVESFLENHEEKLGNNLSTHLENLRSQRINLENDNVFTLYSEILQNTDDHLNVYHYGVLNENYSRAENVFGYTPCDYVINKLLYFYNTEINRSDNSDIEKNMLKLLTNLRTSVSNINRAQEITSLDRECCINERIEEMLLMI